MDPSADVLLAYKMNGDELPPDHGYPIRIIIPGYIGGRMIKWLKEITVGSSESDNHYHFFDNRVLPSGIDAERALSEGWWYKPQYIINELNINSTIIYPSHNEMVCIGGRNAVTDMKITGYAYAGGGLPISRVEVSFDDGITWELSNLLQPEKPRHMGKYWCWSFWEYKVDVMRLLNCREIICRAWQGQNTQPKDLTWNLLGMMNNCHFRCKVHPCRDDSGYLAFRFEHPTQAGPLPGGWMSKGEEATQVIAVKKAAAPKKDASPTYSKTELSKHAEEKDCWIAVESKVYDVTSFLADHPGGGASIMLCAGQDATDEFNSLHSSKARAMLEKYYIGELVEDEDESKQTISPKHQDVEVIKKPLQLVALNPREKIKVALSEREELTHNTRRFRFALPTPDHKLGLPVGQHLFISGMWKGEFVMRAYTPVTGNEVNGYVDLVVKVYRPNERFPEGGKMSQLLDSLNIGDKIDMKGPLGEIEYKGSGEFIIHDKPRKVTRLGMIAGGTGVTPMYQVAKYILSNPDDQTEMWLLLANQSEDDILLKTDLDALALAHPTRFHVHYTVDKVVGDYTSWAYSVGFVCEDMIQRHLPSFSAETITFMCGPPGMIKFACIPNLEKLGYNDQHFFSF
jgi:nitrate reductase (NAD(P)H)